METNNISSCQHCNKTLHGRKDKKFCNDACRNAFNNNRIFETEQQVRKINSILRRNRKLLSGLVDNRGLKAPTVNDLLRRGFDFDYHTHVSKPDLVTNCYEYGYKIHGDDKIKLFYKPILK